MMDALKYLLFSTVLAWVMLVAASLLRSRGWTANGLKVAFGNRDDVDEPSAIAARADRAAKNMLENLVLFACVLFAAQYVRADFEKTLLGAQIFFYARLAYFLAYLAGIKYLRTLIWMISIAGMGLILWATYKAY